MIDAIGWTHDSFLAWS